MSDRNGLEKDKLSVNLQSNSILKSAQEKRAFQ